MPSDDLNLMLQRLERFLDLDLANLARAEALNDESVPHHVVLAFLRTLGREDRLTALFFCWRPEVLAAAVAFAAYDDLAEILANPATPPQVVLAALDCGADEGLRCRAAEGHAHDPDVVATLLTDPSARVRAALDAALHAARRDAERASDQQRGGVDTLAWLHVAVPATEVEDQLESRAQDLTEAENARQAEELARHPDPAEPSAPPADVTPTPDPELDEAMALIELVFRPDRPWDPC